MGQLRTLIKARGRRMLSFMLAALAMQALVPAGVMLSPAPAHGAQVTLCPQTHPLARAAAEKASDAQAAMAEMHAAMGHAMIDHAAMGHGPASADDDAPASAAASAGQSCAFAGAGGFAGLLPDHNALADALRAEPPVPPLPLQPLRLAAPPRLRPPLRGPPVQI